MVLSYGGDCIRISFSQHNGTMDISHPPSLQGNHEEADTLIAFHTANVGSILVRASATDVIVILVGMLGRNLLEGRSLKVVVMHCGKDNTRRYIDITSVVYVLERQQAGLTARCLVCMPSRNVILLQLFTRRAKPNHM